MEKTSKTIDEILQARRDDELLLVDRLRIGKSEEKKSLTVIFREIDDDEGCFFSYMSDQDGVIEKEITFNRPLSEVYADLIGADMRLSRAGLAEIKRNRNHMVHRPDYWDASAGLNTTEHPEAS